MRDDNKTKAQLREALADLRQRIAELEAAETERVRTEEALRASEERFRTVADFNYDWEYWVDPGGNCIYVSPACERITGYRADEFARNPDLLKSIICPDDRSKVIVHKHTAIETGEILPIDFRIVTRSGEERWIGHVCQSVYSDDGRYLGERGSNRDITERVRAEESLRESEEKLRSIVENSTNLFYSHTPEHKLTYLSPQSQEFLQCEPEEAMIRWTEFTTANPVNEAGFALTEKAIKTAKRQPAYQLELMGKKGRRIWVEVREAPIVKDGKTVAIVGSLTDITERLRATEERERLRATEERERLTAQIREEARRVQQIIVTVPEGVLLLDAEGHIVLANPVAEGDLAILADAQVGDTLTHLGNRPLAEFLTSPPTKGLWHEVKAGDRTFEVIARPMENDHVAEDWVLVIRDVTREREIEWRTQQQERLAAVGQLAAGVAHDFNNIMATIVLYTKMSLRAPDLPPKIRKRLETISGQAYRATDLVQQILDFSRRAVLERRPMDLTTFLKEVVELLGRTVPESIKLEFTYGADEYTVNADPTRMQQVIVNLVVNARDAILPKGGGELRIALSSTTETDEIECVTCGQVVEGKWVRIAVTDTGSGIPPDVLPHIFEPFFTTKAVGKGTGLGLAQVYGIVKQHEGHIGVSTEGGVGTTFTLYLPALLSFLPEVPVQATEVLVQGQGETVLVVEDDVTLRAALAAILELLNYRVLEAADGREALDILERHAEEVVLVLSDLVMPEMGGQALFHAMRQRGLMLPVVMLSGHPMENELEALRSQGLAGWLRKPPDLEQLAQLLARALKAERLAAGQ